MGESDSAVEQKSARTAGINQAVKDMMQTKRTLDLMVPIARDDDVEALAAWHTASHVERAP